MMSGAATGVFFVQLLDDLVVVSPQGDLHGFRYHDIHTETNAITERLRREGAKHLLIDFSDVEIIGSVMISAIIKMARQHGVQNGIAAFCGASPTMREVLETMNLTRLWPCFDSRDEAIRSFDG